MRKASLAVVMTLFFLMAGVFLLPNVSPAATVNRNEVKTLQHYVSIGRLPDGIKKQIEERGKADVIITFDESDARERAKQMRETLGLRIDNAEIVNEKASFFNIKKNMVLSGIPSHEYVVLQDYDKLPVIYIEVNENALRKLLQTPDVALIGENNLGLPQQEESLDLIDAPEANSAGATGAGTSVAVLDSGVMYYYYKFGLCDAPCVPTYQPGDPNCPCKVDYMQDFTPDDDGDIDDHERIHGTNVSDIVIGVARDTRILGLDIYRKILVNGQYKWVFYDADVLAALNWVIANTNTYKIKAVNMSFGTANVKYTAPCPQDNLASPISNLKALGVTTVISAGNDGFSDGITRPACIPDAISVGAVYDSNMGDIPPWPVCDDDSTYADKVACFSNRATFLNIFAPGSEIYGGGVPHSGTSQAAPHVSGAVAAIKDVIPGLTPDGVRALFTSTGESVERDGLVKPRLDLLAATPIACATDPVRISGGSSYASLQAAYNAAANGAIIQATKSIVTGNLSANGNKTVTLQGGYDCNFTPQSNTGVTYIKGSIHGALGSLTLRNVILIH